MSDDNRGNEFIRLKGWGIDLQANGRAAMRYLVILVLTVFASISSDKVSDLVQTLRSLPALLR